MDVGSPCPASRPLEALVRRLEAIVDRADDAAFTSEALDAVRCAVRASDLLQPEHRIGSDATYRRHLLYADADGRFSVLALVWRPGQCSPVHGHTAWCAVGVIDGEVTEQRFVCGDLASSCDPDTVRAVGAPRRFGPGAVFLSQPGSEGVHRVANEGTADLITLHVYGCDLAADPTVINVVYAA